MRLTMDKAERLLEALEAATGWIEEIQDDLQTWVDLDGERDVDSREQRRDAREVVDEVMDELAGSVADLAEALGMQVTR